MALSEPEREGQESEYTEARSIEALERRAGSWGRLDFFAFSHQGIAEGVGAVT